MIRRLLSNVIETALPSEIVPPSHSYLKNELVTFRWLMNTGPCFPIQAKNISILTEPDEFYNTLLINCHNAKERITFASLYLGTGPLEQRMLNSIKKNPSYQNNSLNINILLDYTRGSRSKSNSRTMLLPLIGESASFKVSLYHTPALRGLLKRIMPDRWNELIGLQHMKLYIFDNTLVISGANLSNDYFTNRQDRYFVIKDKDLCDFYCGLVTKVQDFSLSLDKNNNVMLSKDWDILPYERNNISFVKKAAENVLDYVEQSKQQYPLSNKNNCDTWIVPLIQMGQLGIEQDALITNKLLSDALPGSKLKIATGYFNLTKQYMTTLTENCQATCQILMAHPKANGFLGAKGLAGGIPYAYSIIAKDFKKMYKKIGQQQRIKLFEYYKEGWTYHAKGLWYYPPNSDVPCLTLIGSPNFGERSVRRDLETQIAIMTTAPQLSKSLEKECSRLYELSTEAETERKVPLWVNAFVLFFRSYF